MPQMPHLQPEGATIESRLNGVRTTASGTAPQNQLPAIWAVGALPPPVTGMTLLTEKVVQAFVERMPVTVASFSEGDARLLPHIRVIRFWRAAKCLAKLILHGQVKNARLYLTCNSKGGLKMTALFVKAARRLGYSLYLHHHVYMYIDEYNRNMAWIDRNMSARDVHLMHCPKMIDDFRARYPSKAQFEYLYPSVCSLPLAVPRQHVPKPFRIGFLANLMLAKGIDRVIETLRLLLERGRDVRLKIAGPFVTKEVERLVTDALARYGGSLSYIGPVFDQQKIEYYNSIDCFVFPSRSEAWPIVLNEALAAGVPIIATNRGCIQTCVGDRAGLVVKDEERYPEAAVRQIETWMDSPEQYCAASRAAIEQADQFQREAAVQLEHLVSRICVPIEIA
jgi:glycosyltransferase involved in cell wall biosynthesis